MASVLPKITTLTPRDLPLSTPYAPNECASYLLKKSNNILGLGKTKGWQKRWFVINLNLKYVENYTLDYYHDPPPNSAYYISLKQTPAYSKTGYVERKEEDSIPKHRYQLQGATLVISGDNIFTLTPADSNYSPLILQAESPEMVKKWTRSLELAINGANERAFYLSEIERIKEEEEIEMARRRRAGEDLGLAFQAQPKSYDEVHKLNQSHRKELQTLNCMKSKIEYENNLTGDIEKINVPVSQGVLTSLVSATGVSKSVKMNRAQYPILRVDFDTSQISPLSTEKMNFIEQFTEDIGQALMIESNLIEVINTRVCPGMTWLTLIEFDVNLYNAELYEDDIEHLKEEIIRNNKDGSLLLFNNKKFFELDEELKDYLNNINSESNKNHFYTPIERKEKELAITNNRKERMRKLLLIYLYDLLLDTNSILYNGQVTCKIDPSYTSNIIYSNDLNILNVINTKTSAYDPGSTGIQTDKSNEFIIDQKKETEIFSSDPNILKIMLKYKDITVPKNYYKNYYDNIYKRYLNNISAENEYDQELINKFQFKKYEKHFLPNDPTHYYINIFFEGRQSRLVVPNPQILNTTYCHVWSYEVLSALGYEGSMQGMYLVPVGLSPREAETTGYVHSRHVIKFVESVRLINNLNNNTENEDDDESEANRLAQLNLNNNSHIKVIHSSQLIPGHNYDVQFEDFREEALNSLSQEELDAIKATFQKCKKNYYTNFNQEDGDDPLYGNTSGVSKNVMEELVRSRAANRKEMIEDLYKKAVKKLRSIKKKGNQNISPSFRKSNTRGGFIRENNFDGPSSPINTSDSNDLDIDAANPSYLDDGNLTRSEEDDEDFRYLKEKKIRYLQQVQDAQHKLLQVITAADVHQNGIISFTEFILAETWWLRCTINPEKTSLFW